MSTMVILGMCSGAANAREADVAHSVSVAPCGWKRNCKWINGDAKKRGRHQLTAAKRSIVGVIVNDVTHLTTSLVTRPSSR